MKFGQTLDAGNCLALVNLIVDLVVWQWIVKFCTMFGKVGLFGVLYLLSQHFIQIWMVGGSVFV